MVDRQKDTGMPNNRLSGSSIEPNAHMQASQKLYINLTDHHFILYINKPDLVYLHSHTPQLLRFEEFQQQPKEIFFVQRLLKNLWYSTTPALPKTTVNKTEQQHSLNSVPVFLKTSGTIIVILLYMYFFQFPLLTVEVPEIFYLLFCC